MPEKNDKRIKELENESSQLKNELDTANQILKTKMEEVNKETHVSFIYSTYYYMILSKLI
jgi:hypothetical protein